MRFLPLFFVLFITSCSAQHQPDQSASTEINQPDWVSILDTMWNVEQLPIRRRDSIGRADGFESETYKKQDEIYHKNHDINEAKLTALLDEYGWPGEAIIGERGSVTICNVIQHSPNEVRLKYLPMMREAVKMKKLSPWLLGRTEDRIATEAGKPQIYGGQVKYYPETKSFDVWPILDPENVDARRAEIGLEPMAEFLKTRRPPLEWDLEAQIKRTEAFLKAAKQKD